MAIPDSRELKEDEIRRVLERASELDGKGRQLNVGELKAVAMEAGISEDAVLAALSEVIEPITAPSVHASTPRRIRDTDLGSVGAWIRSATLLGFGGVLAAVQNSTTDRLSDLLPISLTILVVGTAVLALRRMDGKDWSFWKRAPLPWLSYLVIGMFRSRPDALVNEFAVPTLAVGAAAVAAGIGLYRYVKRWRAGSSSSFAGQQKSGFAADGGLAQ